MKCRYLGAACIAAFLTCGQRARVGASFRNGIVPSGQELQIKGTLKGISVAQSSFALQGRSPRRHR